MIFVRLGDSLVLNVKEPSSISDSPNSKVGDSLVLNLITSGGCSSPYMVIVASSSFSQ